jgi:DNA-binding CsgD family transcriptional regulator
MAASVEIQARTNGGCGTDQERLGAALVTALELALVAAHRLLGELDRAAGRHAETAAHLEWALTLAGSGGAPQEREPALWALAEPRGAAGEPAVEAPPAEPCARPVSLDTKPPPDRAERAEAHVATGGCTPPACPHGLTRREGEVLRLIAAGRSNREIAAALFLSPRTAERHVANIYLKIGAHSKAEAAAYALRHGLA